MGILLIAALGVGNSHVGQQFEGALFCFGGGNFLVVEGKSLLDLLADGLQGVEGGHGVLEDHGDALAADGDPFLFLLELGEIHPAVFDGAVVDPAVVVQKTHKGLGEHRLAGAGLAHDGEAFALVQIQADAADGVEHLAPQAELDVQVFDGQNDFVFHDFVLLTHGFSGRKRPQRRCRSDRSRW